MATGEQLYLKLVVDFDADPKKLNVILNALKNSLGDMGKDIKLINADELAADFRKVDKEVDNTTTGIREMDKAMSSTGGKNKSLLQTAFTFNQIQQSVVGLTSALSPFLNEFTELDKQVKNIGTLGREDFEEFSGLALQLAADIPGSAADMANGIYQAISAGAEGTAEEISQFVEVAAKAGVAGLSDTTTAVNGLTSVLNAYGQEYDNASTVADTFFAGIKKGKTTFEELNSVLATFVPSASAMGLAFDQSVAAVSRLTSMGTPTAQAGTQINAVLTLLQKGTAPLNKALAQTGLTLDDLRAKLKRPVEEGGGLVNVMRDIQNAADSSGTQVAALTGRVEAAKAIQSLAGDLDKTSASLQVFDDVAAEVAGGASAKAFDIASQSIAAKTEGIAAQIQQAFSGVVNSVGAEIVPALNTLNQFGPALAGVSGAAGVFGSGLKKLGGTALNFAGKLGGVGGQMTSITGIMPKAALAFKVFWRAATGPIGLIIGGIAAITAGVVALVDWLHVSAEERLEEAKAEREIATERRKNAEEQVKNQENIISANQKLVDEYERLGKKVNKTAEEEERFLKIRNELINQYPDAIDGTKSFEDNLEKLRGKLSEDNEELGKLNEQLRENRKLELAAKTEETKANVDFQVEELEDNVTDDIIGSTFRNQGREAAKAQREQVQELIKGIKNASSDTDLLKAKGELLSIVGNSDLDNEDKQAAKEHIAKTIQAQKEALDAESAELENAFKDNMEDVQKELDKNPPSFTISDEEIKRIAKESGKSFAEVKKAVKNTEAELRKSKVGEILTETATIQGDIKKVTRIDDLVKAFEEAETEAQKSAIGNQIKEIAPEMIKSSQVVKDENGNIIDSFELQADAIEDVKQKNIDRYSGDLLAKQGKFVELMGEEGEQYRNNEVKIRALMAQVNRDRKLGLDTSEAEAELNRLNEANKKSINEVIQSTVALAQQGEVSNKTYEDLGKQFGLSGDQLKDMVQEAINLKDETGEAADEAERYGDSFNEALKKAKENQADAVSNISEINRLLREGNLSEQERADLIRKRNEFEEQGKQATADINQSLKLQEEAEKSIGAGKKETTKKAKELYNVLKDQFDQETTILDNNKEKNDIAAEHNRLVQGREKTLADEYAAEQRTLDLLQSKKAELEKIFNISTAEDGSVDVDANIKSDQKDKVLKDYNKLVNDINKGDNKQLEIQSKLNIKEEELLKTQKDLEKSDLQFQIDTSVNDADKIKSINELKSFYQSELSAINNQISDTESQIAELSSKDNLTLAQREELIKLKENLAELEKSEMDTRKNINSQIDKVYDIRLKNLQSHYDKEQQIVEDKLNNQADLSNRLSALATEVTKKNFDEQLNSEINSLEQQQDLRLANIQNFENTEAKKAEIQEHYNQLKLEKEEEYAAKKQALDIIHQGFELEQQREIDAQKLQIKQQRIQDEIALLEETDPESEELIKLRDQLDGVTKQVNEKSDEFKVAKDALGSGLSEAITAGFQGNVDALKAPLRESLQISAGALKKKAESAVMTLVMGQLESIGSLGFAGVLLLPVIKAAISGVVNAALNPILSSITSFSTGGRVDQPTLAWVGDASEARPGPNTEWIMRDKDINYMLEKTAAKVTGAVLPKVMSFNSLIAGQLGNAVSRFSNMLISLAPMMDKNNITYNNITNYFSETAELDRLKSLYRGDQQPSSELYKQLEKQKFKIRKFASGIEGGAISSPELIMAGDTGGVPEFVVRQDQLNQIESSNVTINTAGIEQKLDELNNNIKSLSWELDGDKIATAVKKRSNQDDLDIIG